MILKKYKNVRTALLSHIEHIRWTHGLSLYVIFIFIYFLLFFFSRVRVKSLLHSSNSIFPQHGRFFPRGEVDSTFLFISFCGSAYVMHNLTVFGRRRSNESPEWALRDRAFVLHRINFICTQKRPKRFKSQLREECDSLAWCYRWIKSIFVSKVNGVARFALSPPPKKKGKKNSFSEISNRAKNNRIVSQKTV